MSNLQTCQGCEAGPRGIRQSVRARGVPLREMTLPTLKQLQRQVQLAKKQCTTCQNFCAQGQCDANVRQELELAKKDLEQLEATFSAEVQRRGTASQLRQLQALKAPRAAPKTKVTPQTCQKCLTYSTKIGDKTIIGGQVYRSQDLQSFQTRELQQLRDFFQNWLQECRACAADCGTAAGACPVNVKESADIRQQIYSKSLEGIGKQLNLRKVAAQQRCQSCREAVLDFQKRGYAPWLQAEPAALQSLSVDQLEQLYNALENATQLCAACEAFAQGLDIAETAEAETFTMQAAQLRNAIAAEVGRRETE